MHAAGSSETLVPTYCSIQRYTQKDHNVSLTCIFFRHFSDVSYMTCLLSGRLNPHYSRAETLSRNAGLGLRTTDVQSSETVGANRQ